jgi:hypothetical protein
MLAFGRVFHATFGYVGFDGMHQCLKGGSGVTSPEQIRMPSRPAAIASTADSGTS